MYVGCAHSKRLINDSDTKCNMNFIKLIISDVLLCIYMIYLSLFAFACNVP